MKFPATLVDRLPRLRGRVSRSVLASLEFLGCTAAVVVASAAYNAFFVDSSFLQPVAGAAVLGALCGAATAYFRRPPLLAAALSAVAFLVYAIYALVPDSTRHGLPTLGALNDVRDVLVGGLARMLTMTPPADVDGTLLAVPVGLAFLGAFASAMLIRRTAVLLPMLPPLLVFIAALLLTAVSPGFRWQITLAFLGCALIVVLLRANSTAADDAIEARHENVHTIEETPELQGGSRSLWHTTAGRVLFGLPVVAGVAAFAVVGGVFLPIANGQSRYDPRAAKEPPLVIEDRLNPLVDVRRQLAESKQDGPVRVFTLRAEPALTKGSLIRVAALDTYDGVEWKSDARFVRTGSELPAGPELDHPRRVTLQVTLDANMRPPYLPHVGRPVAVDAKQVAFDEASGMLATGVHPLGGYDYQVTGEIVTPSQSSLTSALPAQGPEFTAFEQLPTVPGSKLGDLAAEARTIAPAQNEPYVRLKAIADRLRSFQYDANAKPGHSIAALARFLPAAKNAPAAPAADRTVTEEQTAAAFAVMARSLGYAARVAVGYDLPAAAANGTYTVTTEDADAWPEVAFAGLGWVAFDPTAARAGKVNQPPPPTTKNGDVPKVTTSGQAGSGGVVDKVLLRNGASGYVLLVLILVVIFLLLATAGVVIAKQVRRKRRESNGSTCDRILGAWRESGDRLLEHGLLVQPTHTAEEVGTRTTDQFGDDAGRRVVALAPLVSTALYAPNEPDEDAVVAAWDLEGELRDILDARRSPFTRLLSWVDPRPLVRTPGRRRSVRRRDSLLRRAVWRRSP
jgi:TgpA N-terminal domain/Transglutaminase-like superfamily